MKLKHYILLLLSFSTCLSFGQVGTSIDLEFEKICLIDELTNGDDVQFYRFYAINTEQIFDRTYDLSESYTATGKVVSCETFVSGGNDTDVVEFAINGAMDSLCLVEDEVRFCVALVDLGGGDNLAYTDNTLYYVDDTTNLRIRQGVEDTPLIYNENFLSSWFNKMSLVMNPDSIAQARISWIGDSNLDNFRNMIEPVQRIFNQLTGKTIAGGTLSTGQTTLKTGYQRSNTNFDRLSIGSGGEYCLTGEIYRSNSTGATLTLSGARTLEDSYFKSFVFQYVKQPNGGTFDWELRNESGTIYDSGTVDTNNPIYKYGEIRRTFPDVLTGSFRQFKITVTSQNTNGVLVQGGIAENYEENGIILNKNSHGGWAAKQFLESLENQSSIDELDAQNADLYIIQLGTNDAGSTTESDIYSNFSALIDSIRTIDTTLTDVLLIAPGDRNETNSTGGQLATKSKEIEQILLRIADEKKCAYLSLRQAHGLYKDLKTRGTYGDEVHYTGIAGEVNAEFVTDILLKKAHILQYKPSLSEVLEKGNDAEGQKITGLSAATNASDAVRFDQLTDSQVLSNSTSGTTETITISGGNSIDIEVGDDLGNHVATQNLNMSGNIITGGSTNGLFVASNGRVGINNTSPSATLEVDGTMMFTSRMQTDGTNATGLLFDLNTSVGNILQNYSTLGSTNRLDFGSGSSFKLWYRSTGNIGINTSNPLEKITLSGGNMIINTEGNGYIIDASGQSRVGFMKYTGIAGGAFASANNIPLLFGHTTESTVKNGTFTAEMALNNGKLGIGTLAPNATLHVDGTTKITGALDMTSQKITNLATATNASDAVRFDQLPVASPDNSLSEANQTITDAATRTISSTVAGEQAQLVIGSNSASSQFIFQTNTGLNMLSMQSDNSGALGLLTSNAQSISFNGQLAMNNNHITSLAYPTFSTHAASKQYVDDQITGVSGGGDNIWSRGATEGEIYRDTTGGNVGIGTNDPNALLHIVGDTQFPVRFESDLGGSTEVGHVYLEGGNFGFSNGTAALYESIQMNRTNKTINFYANGDYTAAFKDDYVFNLQPTPLAPATAIEGDIYADDTGGHLRYYDGATWQQLSHFDDTYQTAEELTGETDKDGEPIYRQILTLASSTSGTTTTLTTIAALDDLEGLKVQFNDGSTQHSCEGGKPMGAATYVSAFVETGGVVRFMNASGSTLTNIEILIEYSK